MPEAEETVDIKKGIAAVGRHLRPYQPALLTLSMLGLVSAAANGFVPYVTGRFLDALIGVSQGNGIEYGGFPLWGILLLAWAFAQLVANNIDWIMDRQRRRIDTSVHLGLQKRGFIHLLHLPVSFHKSAHINGVLEKINMMSWRVAAIVRTIMNIAPQLLSVVIGIVLAASINLELALILVGGVAVYSIILFIMLRPVAKFDADAHKFWNEGWNRSAEAVHQVESVKQAAAEEYEAQKIESLTASTARAWYSLENYWSNIGFSQRMIVFVTQLAVFVVSVRFVSEGIITVGDLVALNGYAGMFFGPFVQLGYSWQSVQNGITLAGQAEEIFDAAEERYAPPGSTPLTEAPGEIVFENVRFQYGEGQPYVLDGLDFRVKPGDVAAFVGESGVGKSTTISLISGYAFPTEGRVLIGDIDTRNINLFDLRRHIAVVPQEVALFNDTIRQNIRYGTFNASDAEVEAVAKKVHLDQFIEGLPNRYDTLVGERGVKLSVGQKQRVAIARAMLRNPSILILDEPTSALDAQTEKTVTEALEELMKDRTTFIIAHRLSTVRKADTILVFEKGKVVEQGKHAALIKKENGSYRQLYEYQIGLH